MWRGFSTYFSIEHRVVAEGGRRLAPGARQRVHEVARRGDLAHPLAAAAGHRLDEDRVADGVGRARKVLGVLVLAVVARDDRHARLMHQRLGGILEPHGPDRRGRGADEDEARRLDRLHEVGVLRQEAVARVDRLRPRRPRRRDDRLAAQVALGGPRAADPHRLVGHRDVPGRPVGVRIDRDRAHAEPAAGLDHAARDFAPVRDQDLAEHAPSPARPLMPGPPPPRTAPR
jgi:hypothetical protein